MGVFFEFLLAGVLFRKIGRFFRKVFLLLVSQINRRGDKDTRNVRIRDTVSSDFYDLIVGYLATLLILCLLSKLLFSA